MQILDKESKGGRFVGKMKFNEKHKKVLDSFLLKDKRVKPGKMFSMPAFYVGGKLFASLYEDGVCIKVPLETANKLVKKRGVDHFKPMGNRIMKEWVLITRKDSKGYLKDKKIFKESIEYVSKVAKKSKKKKKRSKR